MRTAWPTTIAKAANVKTNTLFPWPGGKTRLLQHLLPLLSDNPPFQLPTAGLYRAFKARQELFANQVSRIRKPSVGLQPLDQFRRHIHACGVCLFVRVQVLDSSVRNPK